MHIKISWKPLFAFWCSIACLLGCAASTQMPEMSEVKLIDASGAYLSFQIKAIQAQQLNGKLNIAITSNEGSMLQINGLDVIMLQAGKQKKGAYQVVYMPGGMQPACVNSSDLPSKLTLIEGENAQRGMRLETELSCQGKKMKAKALFTFSMPDPEYAAPMNTQ